mmetsp:Transcript_26197/g.71898  ORF Transcript_26197/g.71898 Transcript_26197/m.71898 type:complete len:200 (-) Transcript_26197:2911-3510(-)
MITSRVVLIVSTWLLLMLMLIIILALRTTYTVSCVLNVVTPPRVPVRHRVMLLIPLRCVLLVRTEIIVVTWMATVLLLIVMLPLLVMLLSVPVAWVLLLLPWRSLRWRRNRNSIRISLKGISSLELSLWSWFERTPRSRSSFVHFMTSSGSLCKLAFIRANIHTTATTLVTLSAVGAAHISYRLPTSVQSGSAYSFVFI